jgi:hypothetical protein
VEVNDKLIKLIGKTIKSYANNVNRLPENFQRDQCLARFQESVMWLEKCINDPTEVKHD